MNKIKNNTNKETIVIVESTPESCLITWDYKKWCEEVTQGLHHNNWDIKVGQYIVWAWGDKKYFGQVKDKQEMLDVHGNSIRQLFIVSDQHGRCLVEKDDVKHTMHI